MIVMEGSRSKLPRASALDERAHLVARGVVGAYATPCFLHSLRIIGLLSRFFLPTILIREDY